MKTSAYMLVLSLVLFACTTGEVHDERLFGRYAPPAIDAGLTLTLLDKDVFVAEWWGQEQRQGKMPGESIHGQWHHQSADRLVLSYVTKEKPRCEAIFAVQEIRGRTVLRLLVPGQFPFVAFFGDEYLKEE